jgi:protease I
MARPETRLDGKRVAILATDGFESSELFEPREALWREAAEAVIVGLQPGPIFGERHGRPDRSVDVQLTVGQARCHDFHALVLPGGATNAASLRADPDVHAFVRDFFTEGKPVAVICHGGWTLADAGVVRGRTLTSYPGIRRDLEAAGATWIDREVVVDGNVVSSRTPADLPAFCVAMVDAIARTPVTA